MAGAQQRREWAMAAGRWRAPQFAILCPTKLRVPRAVALLALNADSRFELSAQLGSSLPCPVRP